jgi:hypothetical protein
LKPQPPEDSGTLSRAHLVDLNVHLARNDREKALDDLANVNGQIQEFGALVPAEAATAYRNLQTGIAGRNPPGDFIDQATRAEASLSQAFPVEKSPYLAFGKWTEAGRLSALAGSPEFFLAPENRKFLRALLHREGLDGPVVENLVEIQRTLEAGEPSALPYPKLRELLESILSGYKKRS